MGRKVVVEAPASTANIGPGFDNAAIAIDLWNTLTLEPGSGVVTITGEGATELPTDQSNLIVSTFAKASNLDGNQWDFKIHNEVPIARGLGSSTSAAALGLLAGWEVTGRKWTNNDLFAALNDIDGHPDNAAACAFGGVTLIAGAADEVPKVIELPVPVWLQVLLVIPDYKVETSLARSILPPTYERSAVVRAIRNAGSLYAAFIQSNSDLFAECVEQDIVHEPWRQGLVPELHVVRDCLADTQSYGVTISGAGPTLAVWAPTSCDLATLLTTLKGCEELAGCRLLPTVFSEGGASGQSFHQ